jgi:hypothetical protein
MMENKYKTLINSCWVVLICCFILKLLGGNFFEIMCNNNIVIKICNFIDKTFLLYIFNFLCYYIAAIFYYKAILKENKLIGKNKLIHLFTLALYIIKLFIQIILTKNFDLNKITLIVLIIDTIFMILPILIINVKLYKRAIIGYLLVLIFQIISMITRNLGIHFAVNSTLLVAIFSIDYYIMIILYYLYSTKTEKKEGDI